jgi:hypothetical protein
VLAAVDSIAPIPVAAAASKDPQTAQHQSTQETRTADVDTRAWASNHVAPSAEQIRDLSLLPHAHANWSEGRGLPSTLFSDDGYLTAASNASPESIAKGFLRAHRALFRLSVDEIQGLAVVKEYRTAHNGVTQLTLQQTDQGRLVYGALETFTIDAHGRIVIMGGPLAPGANTSGTPHLAPEQAILTAASAVGARANGSLQGKQVGSTWTFPNVFASDLRSPSPLTAELVTFPSPPGLPAGLAWKTVTEIDHGGWYESIIDAATGTVLFRQNYYQHAAEGTVFLGENPGQGSRQITSFTGASFDNNGWVSGQTTSGNSVVAYQDLNDSNAVGYQPKTTASNDAAYQHFDYSFKNAYQTSKGTDVTTDRDAMVTQLFYYTNFMHDYLYNLGFNEAAGNFQVDNFSRGGQGNDPLLAEVDDGFSVGKNNNSDMATPPDGQSPRMQMFVFTSPLAVVDGTLDADVVFHEYTHGLSHRLVGGGNLGQTMATVQTGAMGEGWSDWVAGSINNDAVIGEYVTGNTKIGIRRYAYDNSPLKYSNLCKGPNGCEVHDDGEIWATVLWDLRSRLINDYGFTTGKHLAEQLIVDGMKNTVSAPSFLDGRDGILAADKTNNSSANQCRIWRVFAAREMGFSAKSSTDQKTATAATDGPPSCTAGLAYAGDNGSNVSDQATLAATLFSPSAPIPNALLTFRLGSQNCTGITASSVSTGQASCTILINQPPGSYTVQVSFAGDANWFGTSLSVPFTIGAGGVLKSAAYVGCTTNTLPANDDGSTGLVTLPNPVNFFGHSYSGLYINNNGNVTFDSSMYNYTPFDLTSTSHVIIAPFFGDVDTRGTGSGVVTYGPTNFGGRPAMCVNWVNVGYYALHTDKLNSFQLLLVDRSDSAAGDFDIIMNYDKIQWETGDASGGRGGLGGFSARVGYSNGTGAPNTSLELGGSAINGAFLDSSSGGLIHRSRNTLVLGRYVFAVRSGSAPTGGSITGHVYHDSVAAGNALASAPVQVCATACLNTRTDATGAYAVSGLTAGQYIVTAYPPASANLFEQSAGPLTLAANGTLVQDLVLTTPGPLPPGTSITSRYISAAGVPAVYWAQPAVLATQGCPGSNAPAGYSVTQGPTTVQSGTMAESPAGTYTATLAALQPAYGYAQVLITLNCPGSSQPTVVPFQVYIDPSGLVETTTGSPIAGATVTLFRADNPGGPFAQVSSGSDLMSPINRANPDNTDAAGHFGWDVVAGYYKIRASSPGCTSPTDPSLPYVETASLSIPPQVTNLDLRLRCIITTATAVSSSANPAAFGTRVTFTATVTATASGLPNPTSGDGTVTFTDGSATLCSTVALSGNQASCGASLSVGTHAIQATYSGSSRFQGSSGGLTEQVNPAPTATALIGTPNPSFVGRPVTLAATVTTNAAGGTNPSSEGSVSFLLGSTTIGSVPLDATGMASLITSSLPIGHDALTAVYSGDANFMGSTSSTLVEVVRNNRIAFSSNRDGNYEIYAMNPDGTGQVRLTNNSAVDTNPAFSPDGTRIAFVSNRSSAWQIWVMNADGTNVTQLTANVGINAMASWSPDGKMIAYSSSQTGRPQIWVINADGSNPRQLTNTNATATTPAWSPDGSQIAFTGTASGAPQIWVMKSDGTNAVRLTNDFTADAMPSWSPDGSKIAFVIAQNYSAAIYVINANGANVLRLTNNGPAIDATPSWSPDGSQLAFTTTINGQIQLFEIRADGSGQTQITTNPAVNALPTWCCTQAP